MKFLIWFFCFFMLAVVQMLFKDAGIMLGAIPTVILAGLAFWSKDKLCAAWDRHKEKKAKKEAALRAIDKTTAEILAVGVIEQSKYVEANREVQSLYQSDPEYGLVPEKPVYCCGVEGSKDYINKLRTDRGEKLNWKRRGSMWVDGIHGMVDIYDSTLTSGQAYKTVYVNMYADTNSVAMPNGFILYFSGKKDTSSPKSKQRFCKLCGDPIDPQTRKCTGCKKQYFRPPVFGDKHYFIAASVVACIAVAVLLFLFVNQRNQYEAQVQKLNTQISELEDEIAAQERSLQSYERSDTNLRKEIASQKKTIESLQAENSKMKSEIRFYDDHVVFVGDDGTKKYHNYDCPYLDLSYFWAYNTEAAIDRGYKACSYCCG